MLYFSLSQLRRQLPHQKKSAIYFSNPAEFYPFQKEFESLLQKNIFEIYNMHKLQIHKIEYLYKLQFLIAISGNMIYN